MLLYAITAGTAASMGGQAVLENIGAAADEGVDLVQIREKALPAAELLALCRAAARRLRERGVATRLLVNDRVDVALAAGLAGVHLPAAGLPVADVRALIARGFLVGVSCHSAGEVYAAATAGADFCVLGPIFDSPGKPAALGPAALDAVAHLRIPVLALGGVTEANAAACLRHGAAGLAGIRLFAPAPRGLGARLRALAPARL